MHPSFSGVSYGFKCDPVILSLSPFLLSFFFFHEWPNLGMCDRCFFVWPIFLRVTHFFLLWLIFLPVTQLPTIF